MNPLRACLLLGALPAWVALAPGAHGDVTPDFTYDVLPLLQRQGCASAYCHGAATGQGGFKLSLFGSDPRADHAAITRDLGGRRLDLRDPDASLLLQKPLLRTKHGGGRRLERDGDAHRLLRAWIGSGARFDGGAARELRGLEAVRVGERMTVTGSFADGRRDVSGLATYSSTDERIARIGADGTIVEEGPGEAWLLARYAGATARVRVLRPFGAPDQTTAPTTTEHALDVAFVARMRELGLAPGAPAAPERLARRLWLDLCGRPPTPGELRRFLTADPHTRMATTADALLATREFVEIGAARLASWLELPAPDADRDFERARLAHLRATLRDAVEADAPLGELVGKVLALDEGFLQRHEDPRDRAEYVGRSLLGLRIGCARCHDHPNDRWRQGEHGAFSACFASPRRAPEGGMVAGMMFDADSGEAIAPRLLPLPGTDDAVLRGDRHAALRAFVLDATHDRFARNIGNRVFQWLFGRGLVEPLDDHRDSNPALCEEWLAVLQAAFHAGGGRMRPLLRFVVTSRLYALDSGNDPDSSDDGAATRWFAARGPKALDGDALRRALAATMGVPVARAPSLPASPLALRLALLNGAMLGAATFDAPGNSVEVIATLGGSAGEQLDELFLTCLTRLPRADERAAFAPDLEASDDRARTLRELAIALLLSREAEFVR